MSPKLRRFLAQYGMLFACMFILAVFLLLPIGLTVYGGVTKQISVVGGGGIADSEGQSISLEIHAANQDDVARHIKLEFTITTPSEALGEHQPLSIPLPQLSQIENLTTFDGGSISADEKFGTIIAVLEPEIAGEVHTYKLASSGEERFVVSPDGAVSLSTVQQTVPTGEHVALVFQNPLYRQGLINSFGIACATTLLCVLISLPLALISARYKFPFKGVWNAVILVPLILPPFVGAIGMRAVLGREGMINALFGTDFDVLGQGRVWGVILVEALHLYPIIFLNATASLANLDPALDEAAENLGAGPIRRFFKIVLPLIRPGLFAGGTIVFIWSFTELGTPLMFEYGRVTPVQIFHGLKEIQSSAEPYALTVVLLFAAIMWYVLGKLVFGRKGYAMYSKASRASSEVKLPWWGGLIATLLFAGVTIAAVLPHVGVVLTSISPTWGWNGTVLPEAYTADHFVTALSDPVSSTSVRNSLILSLLAVVGSVLMGLVAAYIIVRTKVRGRGLLDAMCMLPLAVPGLVMAFGYFAMTLSGPIPAFVDMLDSIGMGGVSRYFQVVGEDPNPFLILAIAYGIRRLPYMVRATVAGLEQTSGELEEAAVNLGAGRVQAFRKVVLPLVLGNVIAGGLLVFSFSMLEVSDSLILAQQSKHFPITKAIYELWNRLGDGAFVASAMGVWGMALLGTTLVGSSILMGKKFGSIFRA